jgi:type VI secretion system protein ImpC
MFPSETELDTKVTLEIEALPIDENAPFHVLLMGDWSGKNNRSDSNERHPIEIDRDNFEAVISKLCVGVDLDFSETGGAVISLEFRELDDFHPDKIFKNLPLFANLRDVRSKLSSEKNFNEAAAEVRSWLISDSDNSQMEDLADLPQTNEQSTENILDQILDKSVVPPFPIPNNSSASSELSSLINKLVKPHLIQTDQNEQSKLLMIVDEVISDLMRKIMHHPDFQSIESAWRGVYLLVRKIETDSTLRLFLLDITKSSLADELKSVNDLSDSTICRLLNESPQPWAILCGNYTFGLNIEDAATLIRLAKISNFLDAPFVSHIQPEMFGINSFDAVPPSDNWTIAENSVEYKLWNTLRSLPEMDYLGLVVPRFLARLPYGDRTEPTEAFYFEEFTKAVQHENYLWANPSFICALLLAQSFRESGWNLTKSIIRDIDNLPVHIYDEDGETNTKSCAEIAMTQSNCERFIAQGLMPLIWFRDTNRVRIGRFQSIGFSESMLKGKWNSTTTN